MFKLIKPRDWLATTRKKTMWWGVVSDAAVWEVGAPELNQHITLPMHINELGPDGLLLLWMCVAGS